MGNVFLITFEQIFILLFFVFIGWLLKTLNIVEKGAARNLSKLELWVFLPALIIKTLTVNFTVDQLSARIGIFIAGFVVAAVTFVLSLWLGKVFGKEGMSKKIFQYAFAIPNTSFIGSPLILAVFGEEMLCDFIVFTLPLLFLCYTWGLYVLTNQERISIKSFNNPIIYSVLIGMILGLLGVKIPGVPMTILTNATNCMAPCAMLLAGIVIGKQSLGKAFTNGKSYAAAAIRLIGIPALVGGVMLLLKVDINLTILAVLMTCMPCGLNVIIFPESMNQDSTVGANLVIISSVLSIITVPLITMLFTSL